MAEKNMYEQYLEFLKKRSNICITSREAVKNGIIYYDVKDEVGYDGDVWQRMCRYKTAKDDLDCDVAQLTVLQYAIAFPFILDGGRTIEAQHKNGLKYEARGNSGFAFRGDIMNSYATTVHKFVSLFSSRSGRISARVILDNYDTFSGLLPKEAMEFMRICHTTGNFIPVPFCKAGVELNRPRGTGELQDYWDKTLWYIYLWYQLTAEDKQKEADAHLLVMVKNNESVELCKQWLKGFRSWLGFVRANYMEPFVHNGYGSPKELWKGHLAEDAVTLPQEREQFEEFFKNSFQWIVERGELIAEAIMQELEKVPGCHPWKEEG